MEKFKEIASVVKGISTKDPRHIIQIETSGMLVAVGVFNSRQKGKDYGEVHVFSTTSAGTWKFMRAFEAVHNPEQGRCYWANVEIASVEYEGVNCPVLRIMQLRHRKAMDTIDDLPLIEILI